MDDNSNNILPELECPVCKQYMYLVIPMCVKGHSICQKCKAKCKCCPVCKSVFGDSQNYTLEKVIAAVKFPCKNIKYGCENVANLASISQHWDDCELGYFPCPLKNSSKCSWEGKLIDLKRHLETTQLHDNIRSYTKDINTNIAIIARFNVLFVVHRKYSSDTGFVCWAVQYIGAKNIAKHYWFTVEFMDETDKRYDLNIASDCIPMCDDQNVFNGQHVKVHIDMIQKYKMKSEHGRYGHGIQIMRKN